MLSALRHSGLWVPTATLRGLSWGEMSGLLMQEARLLLLLWRSSHGRISRSSCGRGLSPCRRKTVGSELSNASAVHSGAECRISSTLPHDCSPGHHDVFPKESSATRIAL